jgi:uncharacterized protein (DUF4415 family)
MSNAVQPLETLLATKMLSLHEGLLNSDRIVGCILLEHFNRRTGRCDPGIERIAALSGFSERTVMRAIVRLVRLKLFVKVRHGGYSNRNRYEPNWPRFAELRRRWKETFSKNARVARESGSNGRRSHVLPDTNVTQTYSSNQLNQTFCNGSAKKENGLPTSQTLGQPSAEAARRAAHRRWDKDLLDHFRGQAKEYAKAVEAINFSLAEGATDAELKQQGSGIKLILQSIIPKRSEGDQQ